MEKRSRCRHCKKRFTYDTNDGKHGVYCSRECHQLYLPIQMKKVWEDHRGTMLASFKQRSLNPNYIATRAMCGKKTAKILQLRRQEDPEFEIRRAAKASASMKRKFEDPKFRARHRRNAIACASRPEIRAKIARGNRLAIRNGLKVMPRPTHACVGKRELLLFAELRRLGLICQHQFAVPGTRFTGDIFVPSVMLIVEVDAHQSHYEPWRITLDRRRNRKLRALGYHVLHLRQRVLGNMGRCASIVMSCVRRLEAAE